MQKSIENAKKRVEVPLTDVLFSKSVSNKFITMQNVVFNMLISCYSIPECVASKYATFRVQKFIDNAKKHVEDAVTDVLFRTPVSNKFINVQNVVSNMLLSCYSIPEFVALK